MRRCVLLLLLLPLGCGGADPDPAGAARARRIVLIVGDDHGWPDSGFMGSEIVSTPNLDRLAASGMTFTHAYSSASVCGPSLRTLLSGLHDRSWTAQRLRLEAERGEPFAPRTEVEHYVTLPRQLARQGYRSLQAGKHWEGTFEMAGYDAGDKVTLDISRFQVGMHFGRVDLEPLPAFLDEAGDEPLFLFLAPKLPHTPFDAHPAFRRRYEKRGFSKAAVLYYANVAWLDAVVGQILDELEARSLLDDSLIIYVSDNGWDQAPNADHLLGLKIGGDRGKLSIHELGFRTPLVFRWPGRVPQGRVVDDLVTFSDLHATILDYAGVPLPPDHEGRSLRGRIEGTDETHRDRVIGVQDTLRVRDAEYVPLYGLATYLRIETAAYLRTDRWRHIEYLDRGERHLFRIDVDPFEKDDVGAEHPELMERFAAETAAWRDELARPAAWMDLFGQLFHEDGAPEPGLRVWLEDQDTSRHLQLQVLTDARGFFRIPNVPAGHFTLRWETEPAPRWSWHRRPLATGSRELDLTGYETSPFLPIPIAGSAPDPGPARRTPGTLEIRLVDRRGAPVAGALLHVSGLTIEGRVELQVLSGPNGFAALDRLPVGIYRILSPNAQGSSSTRFVFLSEGTTREVVLATSGQQPNSR